MAISKIGSLALTNGGGSVATNTASGTGALNSNTSGAYNSAFGYQAAYSTTTSVGITAFGANALYSTTASDNCGIGTDNPGNYKAALESNTSGRFNTAVATGALGDNSTGSYNTAVGHQALTSNTTASNNTAVGYQAGYSNTTALYSTYIGMQAGYSTTGERSTFVGMQAGYNITTGIGNTIIGRYNGDQGGLDIRTSNYNIVLSDGDGNPRGVFDGSGRFLVGITTTSQSTQCYFKSSGGAGYSVINSWNNADSGTRFHMEFRDSSSATSRGSITTNGSNTTYSTSSDYRLKENIAPMTGALAKVQALKPCTYTWKSTSEQGEGFIAHELAEVVPQAVIGEKDAVNEDGSIKAQSIDTSFLVATLTAAIQELKTEFDEYKRTHP